MDQRPAAAADSHGFTRLHQPLSAATPSCTLLRRRGPVAVLVAQPPPAQLPLTTPPAGAGAAPAQAGPQRKRRGFNRRRPHSAPLRERHTVHRGSAAGTARCSNTAAHSGTQGTSAGAGARVPAAHANRVG